MWEDKALLGTAFHRIFCVGIGPLQLGVVLALLLFSNNFSLWHQTIDSRTECFSLCLKAKNNNNEKQHISKPITNLIEM